MSDLTERYERVSYRLEKTQAERDTYRDACENLRTRLAAAEARTKGLEHELGKARLLAEEELRARKKVYSNLLLAHKQLRAAEARAERLERALVGFMDEEFRTKADWLGLCAFRRSDVRCQGTDGHNSALGTPRPTPHSEFCPYHKARAALAADSTPPHREPGGET
jgi:hypothetical protein